MDIVLLFTTFVAAAAVHVNGAQRVTPDTPVEKPVYRELKLTSAI
jgi:hypothetical protein